MPKLLVANRGEIALRIFRTAERMGMGTVAVYSDADADAVHVGAAGEAVRIGPAPAAESYLRRDRLVRAALDSGAELVHPGYGFLAEDSQFAADVRQAGLTFVGPPPEVLRLAGDKAAARDLALRAGVSILPAVHGDGDALAAAAGEIGFPVVVKPVGGGGGKGMTIVREADRLQEALEAARRMAGAAFDDDRLLVERYLQDARHVEVQILADAHGHVVHLGERDCSLQRRHQKVIEETPAPCLDPSTRSALHDAAVTFARAASYVGAGTCEFLVSPDGSFGFIEMNARLQVEHPVTELVCGMDLVEHQLRVAMGEPLSIAQGDVTFDGHAVEARVYAEDPETEFLPQAGKLLHVRWPATPQAEPEARSGVRVDHGVVSGSEVPSHYDPLLAKIVAHGPDRNKALARLNQALGETEILGVRTNVGFLAELVSDSRVRRGEVSTTLLEGIVTERAPSGGLDDRVTAVAAAAEKHRLLERVQRSRDPWERLAGWRGGRGDGRAVVVLHCGDHEIAAEVGGHGPFDVGGVQVEQALDDPGWLVAGRRAAAVWRGDTWLIWFDGYQHEVAVGPRSREGAGAGPARLDSPLPGRVISVRVQAGAEVSAGAELVVIEAMKMEHAVTAPDDAVVKAVLCSPGEQVERGQPLVELDS